jgi:bidirectional [NiFe] hydrogenase diaphorase subunit
METYLGKPSPPSDDKRWKLVAATMRRHGHQRHALIETLHTVQQSFGFLDDVSLRFVAHSLRLSLSQAYGVATFYHFFGLKPPGEHTCVVCMGTACYIKGAPALLAEAERSAGLKPGETTLDGRVSFLTARCLGSCSLAPAVVFDGEVAGKVGPSELHSRLQMWTNHAS